MTKQYCCFGHTCQAKSLLPKDFDLEVVQGTHYEERKLCGSHYQLAKNYVNAIGKERKDLREKIEAELSRLTEERKKNVSHFTPKKSAASAPVIKSDDFLKMKTKEISPMN